jgi:AAA domain
MRLTRIGLHAFKGHAALEVEPAPGLTVIRGPNESGKSTLQQAIGFALFRKADGTARDMLNAQRWGAATPPRVELDFDVDGSRGHLVKTFAPGKGTTELSIDGQSISDPNAVAERITTMTGIPSEKFFRSTASVGHAELTRLDSEEPLIADRLQQAISGADQGTAVAKRKLDDAIRRYRSEGPKNPGRLKSMREEIERLEVSCRDGEAALEQLEADRGRWVAAREKRLELDAQLARQEADLAEAERAVQLADRRDAAQSEYERLRRGVELVEAEDGLQRTAPTTIPLAQLRTTVGRIGSLSYDMSELEADIEVGGEVAAADAMEKPGGPWRWIVIGVILAVVGWLLGIVLGDVIGLVALIGFGVATFVALGLGMRAALRVRQWGYAREMARRAAITRRDHDRDRQESFRRRRREFESSLSSIGVETVDEANSLLAAAETYTAELARVEGELRGLRIDERDVAILVARRDTAANDAEQARHALSALGELGTDPMTTRKRAQMLVDGTRPMRERARSEEDQALGRVDANEVDAEQVAAASERLRVAKESSAMLTRRLAVYQDTLQAIEKAEAATMKTAARFLEERMGPAMATITGGRYDQVLVDEKDLAFRVVTPEHAQPVGVESLSQGTADQLYLVARLGLVRLITMDKRPPLILDDPFVTFDPERAERALKLVREVAAAQGYQVLYLTCSDRYDALADKVVVLEGPQVAATTTPESTASPEESTPESGTPESGTPDEATHESGTPEAVTPDVVREGSA